MAGQRLQILSFIAHFLGQTPKLGSLKPTAFHLGQPKCEVALRFNRTQVRREQGEVTIRNTSGGNSIGSPLDT